MTVNVRNTNSDLAPIPCMNMALSAPLQPSNHSLSSSALVGLPTSAGDHLRGVSLVAAVEEEGMRAPRPSQQPALRCADVEHPLSQSARSI